MSRTEFQRVMSRRPQSQAEANEQARAMLYRARELGDRIVSRLREAGGVGRGVLVSEQGKPLTAGTAMTTAQLARLVCRYYPTPGSESFDVYPLASGLEDDHPKLAPLTPIQHSVSVTRLKGETIEDALSYFGNLPAQKPQRKGPGSHLKLLLAELGLRAKAGCDCTKRQRQMDEWGVEGCREHRGEILAWLVMESGRASWASKLRAGFSALLKGSPMTPAGLVDEAIRRAEAEAANV